MNGKNGEEKNEAEEKLEKENEVHKIEELLHKANQLYLDMIDEKYIIVFVKIYTYINGNPIIELKDYFLMNKYGYT